MDEAVKLIDMAVAAMFAAMLLGVASVLITLFYQMWSYFARQDAANQRMQEYANYSSFDNTTVRGQEVVQLIENHYDEIFVVIYDSSPIASNVSIDSQTVKTNPIACCALFDETVSTANYTPNVNTTLNNALSIFKSWSTDAGRSILDIKSRSGIIDLTSYAENKQHKELTQRFLESKLCKPDSNGEYAAFKSSLVYDNDKTTDIVGIVLVRESKYVTQY